MNITSRHVLCLGALAGLLSACGSGSGLPGIIPTISISSPANNSSVNLSPNKTVSINFESNYVLKAPATCAGLANCGHVYLLIDNTSCNTPNMPYNTLAVASPVQALPAVSRKPTMTAIAKPNNISCACHSRGGTARVEVTCPR